MGAHRFERLPNIPGSNADVVKFDSSWRLRIARKYGLDEKTMRKELIDAESNENCEVYWVYAQGAKTEDAPDKELTRRGKLTTLTKKGIRDWHDGGYARKPHPPTEAEKEARLRA